MSFLDTQDLLTNSSSSSAPSGDLGDLGVGGMGGWRCQKKRSHAACFN